jgi:hypothetical protein
VETIQADAFYNCSSLASVKLGENVATINPLAFEMCSSLTSITVEEGSKTYSAQDGVLYNQDKTTLVYYPLGSTATEYTVIASTETIGDYAFYNHSNLQSITLPDGLTTIGDNAFNTCFALESVIIPNTVTSIGTNAFNRCTALESVTIGSGVTSIKYDAFSNCSSTNLKKVYIYDVSAWCNISFENASSNPLSYAHNLYLNNELVTDLELPSTVNSIGNYAFDSCTSLTSVSIPESVTSIGLKAFEYCSNLTSITVNANNTVYSSDDGVLFDHDKTTLICCPAGKSGSYIISDKVEKIESYAFYYCSSLTSVTIGSGVTYIAKYAFLGCSNLTSATFTVTSSWSYSGTMTMNSSSGSSSVYTVNENVSASDLANTSTAATYIVNYSSYEWKRS